VTIRKQSLIAVMFAVSLTTIGCGAVSKNSNLSKPASTENTAAPVITVQPLSRTVSVGQAASFSVTASGTGRLSYQWQKNGAAITGANAAIYSVAAAVMADKGSAFSVVVSNEQGSVTSSTASLTVSNESSILNASVNAVNFGDVEVGASGTQSVTLTNAGTGDVTIGQVTVAGAGFNTTGLSGITLKAGESTVLAATFAPSATGASQGRLVVSSNATNSPAGIGLTLAGNGIPAAKHTVTLNWTPSGSNATGFNAYSSPVAGGPYTKLTSAPLSTPNFTDDNVKSGQTYYYVVTSVGGNNQESVYSKPVTAVIP
jgi:Abnormal spindle-like microcephaly-assoc'd, ASPM-SPD-2-Hydin/Immunoglobulin I-set domain